MIHKKTKIIITAVLIALVSVLPTAGQANAQQTGLTLSISPPLFELTANPGESLENKIRLTNLSDQQQQIVVSRKNFTAQGEEGEIDLTENSTNWSLAEWITVDQETATVPAKSDHVFNFRIDVPATAEPGGHFGSLLFRAESKPASSGSAATVSPEIGSLILVKVAGDVNEKAQIAEFTPRHNLYETAPIDLITRIKNDGNVHFKPRGSIVITNAFGQEVTSIPFDERNVLPGSIRRFQNTWQGSGFMFGHYTATLSLAYGPEDRVLTSTTSFWIIPWKLIVTLLVIIGLLVFAGWRWRSRFAAAFRALAGK